MTKKYVRYNDSRTSFTEFYNICRKWQHSKDRYSWTQLYSMLKLDRRDVHKWKNGTPTYIKNHKKLLELLELLKLDLIGRLEVKMIDSDNKDFKKYTWMLENLNIEYTKFWKQAAVAKEFNLDTQETIKIELFTQDPKLQGKTIVPSAKGDSSK